MILEPDDYVKIRSMLRLGRLSGNEIAAYIGCSPQQVSKIHTTMQRMGGKRVPGSGKELEASRSKAYGSDESSRWDRMVAQGSSMLLEAMQRAYPDRYAN